LLRIGNLGCTLVSIVCLVCSKCKSSNVYFELVRIQQVLKTFIRVVKEETVADIRQHDSRDVLSFARGILIQSIG